MHTTRSVRALSVRSDGKNLISHAGTALLAEIADRSGLTKEMSSAMSQCGIAWKTHDPGVVLTHLAVAIADGADCLSDLSVLREQSELFGPVASLSTAWRAMEAVASVELREIRRAVGAARAKVWEASPPEESLVLDFDATLVTSYSENKYEAAPTYKGGFGFHPLGVWCDNTNEPLAALLRSGNAGSNDANDHLELLDQAIAALPASYQLGHQVEDSKDSVVHPILIRADSAGATHGFIRGIVEANCEFSIGHPITGRVRDALRLVQEEEWACAVEHGGEARDGAEIVEISGFIDTDWPEGTRLIVRRERPHPGAQLTLFDTEVGWRHTCFMTNTQGCDISVLELRHRGHARVEDRVRNWKDCGLANLPFGSFVSNMAWVAITLIAGALLAWSQLLCFDGSLTKAEPKTIRYRVLHIAGQLARRGRRLILRVDQTWPWAKDLVNAFTRLRTAIT